MTKQCIKIITACKQGLCRSVGLADVLKLHFEPVDVIPLGLFANSEETLVMLGEWCDWFVIMEDRYRDRVPAGIDQSKILVCEVGQDTYGHSHNPELIDKCWRWSREQASVLGIREHQKRL